MSDDNYLDRCYFARCEVHRTRWRVGGRLVKFYCYGSLMRTKFATHFLVCIKAGRLPPPNLTSLVLIPQSHALILRIIYFLSTRPHQSSSPCTLTPLTRGPPTTWNSSQTRNYKFLISIWRALSST